MANKKYDNEDGVWRTIGGRRVFIKKGQSVAEAMKESGKFKSAKKEESKKDDVVKKDDYDEPIEKKLEKQHRYAESEAIKDIKDKYMPERTKAVGDYQNGAIDRDELLKRFDGNEERMIETFEQLGYTPPTKENIDKANANARKRAEERKEKETKAESISDKYEVYEEENGYRGKGKDLLEFIKEEEKDTGEKAPKKLKEQLKENADKEFFFDNTNEKINIINETMNDKIREKASKKSKSSESDLPKHVEIKEQGTSNRKEVSENIQAHILEHYDSPQDFLDQMDNVTWQPTNWHKGQQLAEDGFYEIYYDDQRKFLDDLKINPKGKDFDDSRVFETYKNLIGRESAKLYDRLKKNAYNEYKKEHPLTKMSFEDFKNMGK